MLEAVSLIFFSLIVYTFLIALPTAIENFASCEFRFLYFKHLADRSINTYGK